MADIRLSKVPSGTHQTVDCAPDSRFVFDFPAAEATITRSGDNLVFTFDDGGALELTGFYATYNSEKMPDFEIDGATISGADFFTAMNEPDLMPAAGPATATVANGARYHEYADSSLAGGIDRLGGLDLGFGRAEEPENDLNAFGMDDGNAPLSAENSAENSGGNIPPAEPEPSVPGNPDTDPNHTVTITPQDPDPEVPGNPEVPGDPSDPSTQGASVTVYESGLKGVGTQAGADSASITAKGILDITAPDGVKSVELSFGNQTVNVADGNKHTLDTDEGTLTVSYADGKLHYSYELKQATQEHTGEGNDKIFHDITVKVTDTDGDSAESTIRVNVVDDVAKAEDDSAEVTRGEVTQVTGDVLTNDTFGADGPADGVKSVTWKMEGATPDGNGGYTVTTDYGTLHLAADGSYTFTLDNDSEALINLKDGSAAIKVPYTITDADGDTADATLTLTVNGKNHPVTITPQDPDPDVPGNPEVPGDPSDPSTQGASVTVYESGLKDDGTQAGAADAPTTAKGILDITAPDGVKSVELSFGGKTVNVNLDGSDATLVTDEGTLTVSYADGKLNYSYTLDKATQEHKNADNDEKVSHDITVKVTDTDGDSATSTIRVNVVDDAPIITVTRDEKGSGWENDSTFVDFDFSNQSVGNNQFQKPDQEKLDLDLVSGSQALIRTQGIQIISTFVKYDYESADGQYHVTSVEDVTSNIKGTLPGKKLWITKDGLTVGKNGDDTNWNGGEIGMAPQPDDSYEIAFTKEDGSTGYNPVQGNQLAEAIVIESQTGTVSYGMAIDFGSIQPTDRVVVSFYLTPRNNNDNELVKQFEMDFTEAKDGAWREYFDVPDGFTKVIVSPIPNKDAPADSQSGFTIREIELTKPVWVEKGSVEVKGGADGVEEGSLDWDWSYYDNNNPVSVVGTKGMDQYTVEVSYNSETKEWEGKLVGKGGELNGRTLFIATLNKDTGEWEVRQFYKFECADNKPPFQFSVEDTDGDKATAPMTPEIEGRFDRFDNVMTGTYKEKWGTNAKYDHVTDTMAGQKGNDLMYGKGGDDLMFGDGGDGSALLQNVWNILGKDAPTVSFDNVSEGKITQQETVKQIDKIFQDAGLEDSLSQDAMKGLEYYTTVSNGTLENYGGKENLENLAEITALRKAILDKVTTDEGQFNKEAFDTFAADLESKLESGNQGDDALFGGIGDDILFGQGGDDYLHGGDGKDMLFGGSGDDLILYDSSDYLVHGGSGIDFLLSGKDGGLHLNDLLENTDPNNGPMVSGVEVLLKGDAVTTLTSLKALEDYGIKVEDDTLTLGEGWEKNGDYYTYDNGSIILETTLTGTPQENGTIVFSKDGDLPQSEALFSGQSGSMDSLLGVSETSDTMPQEPDERSLDLTNMDTRAYSGLGKEREEKAAGADSGKPDLERAESGGIPGCELTEASGNEEELAVAINAIRAETGGC